MKNDLPYLWGTEGTRRGSQVGGLVVEMDAGVVESGGGWERVGEGEREARDDKWKSWGTWEGRRTKLGGRADWRQASRWHLPNKKTLAMLTTNQVGTKVQLLFTLLMLIGGT